METTVLNDLPLTLSIGAIEQLKRIKEEQQIPDSHGLRVGVKGGGCSGFSYVLGFDTIQEKDQVFEIGGFKVLMERAHSCLLYTFDAADERSSVDLGGHRIIKKKKNKQTV